MSDQLRKFQVYITKFSEFSIQIVGKEGDVEAALEPFIRSLCFVSASVMHGSLTTNLARTFFLAKLL